jgi:hypothetical protein
MAFFRGEVLATLLAAAQAPAAAGDRARRILEDPSYQRDLPAAPPPDAALPTAHVHAPGSPLLELLAYAGLAVVVVLALAWLVRRFATRGDADVALPGDAPPPPLRVEIAGPEALAAAGRYAEAIHELLLETLAALSRAGQLAPSFTSREILERVRLPEQARDALSGLVLAVEVSRFGGVSAGEADYRLCLDRFHGFLESYRRPAREAAA